MKEWQMNKMVGTRTSLELKVSSVCLSLTGPIQLVKGF